MNLENINVEKLLSDCTVKYIKKHADFDTLRSACLEVKPIEPVVTEIRSLLNTEFKSAFESKKTQLATEFFNQQINEDANQKAVDKAEKSKDAHLIINLSNHLCELYDKIQEVEKKNNEIYKTIDELESKQLVYKKNLTPYQEELKKLKQAAELRIDVHPYQPYPTQTPDIQGNVYPYESTLYPMNSSLSINPRMNQEEYEDQSKNLKQPIKVQVYPNSYPSLPSSSTIPVDPRQKEYEDKIEKLQKQIKNIQNKVLLLSLERIGNELRLDQLKKDVKNTNDKIGQEIPTRELERKERASARKKRANIRERFSQDIKQLTPSNQEGLQKSIIEAEKTLRSHLNSLISQVEKESYSHFLKLLPVHIPDLSNLNANILSELSQTMQQYKNLQEEINQLLNELDKKEQQFQNNKESLADLEKRRAQLIKSTPELDSSIKRLKNEKIRLEENIKNIELKIQYNRKVCGAMLLLVGLIIVSIGMLLYLNTVPINLIHSTIGLGTAALASLGFFACRFLSSNHERTKTKAEISKNEKEIKNKETEQIVDEQQISEVEKETIQIKQELDQLPSTIQNLKQKIDQTTVIATELFKIGALKSEPFVPQGNINLNFFKEKNNKEKNSNDGNYNDNYYAPSFPPGY